MDLITKNIARGLISTIGTEKIAKMSGEIITGLIGMKNEIPLQEGEDDVIGILYEIDGIAHFAQAVIIENQAGNTEIKRFISVKTVNEMLKSLFDNI